MRRFLPYVIALQESFAAIVPFVLFSSLVTLVYFLGLYLGVSPVMPEWVELKLLMDVLNGFSSVAIVISITYFLARRGRVSEVIAVLLSLMTFLSIVWMDGGGYPLKLPHGFTLETILVPILSVLALHLLHPRFSLSLPLDNESRHVFQLINYLFSFIFAYVFTLAFFFAFDAVKEQNLFDLEAWLSLFPDVIRFTLRDLFVQASWFFGIHGSHMANALLGKETLRHEIIPGLSFSEYNRLFVALGGAGIGWALLISMLIHARNKTHKALAYISIPFVLFNVNTLLIYAVIVFNRRLLVPFILLPMCNFLAGYVFLKSVPIHFGEGYFPWMMPSPLYAYFKSGGDLRLISFLLLLLAFDVWVYSHYLKRFFQSQQIRNHASSLEENLHVQKGLYAEQGVHAFARRKEEVEANSQLQCLLPDLTEEKLFIYYQPLVHIDDHSCHKYEALIRFRQDDGSISGPFFLGCVETAGLAPIFDVWVSRRVRDDLDRWKTEGYYPDISINLHPDTLVDPKAIRTIMSNLKDYNITFEVLERSFIRGKESLVNLEKLQSKGFAIAIDDFGIGYSNLETLTRHEVQLIKIDRALIGSVEERNGYLVCRKIVELCHEIGYLVVAEGVETETQYTRVTELGVDFVQGYYFTPALPFDKARKFAENMNVRGEHQGSESNRRDFALF